MSRINKFVLTVSLLIFIMISAVACGIYTQMVKERVYSLKQSVIDTAFAVANIAEYRRSVAIDLINTLNPTEEQLLVGLRTAYADSVSPSYLYDVGPYLISSDECIQVKEFEKNYCADIMQVVKYRHVKNTGFISFDGKTFVYYLYPVTHNRSLIFLLGLERFSLLSKSLAMDSENLIGFAPIFPDICYHLTHYKPAAADIPVASDNPAHYADAIRYNARTPLQGSLLPLTRLVWA